MVTVLRTLYTWKFLSHFLLSLLAGLSNFHNGYLYLLTMSCKFSTKHTCANDIISTLQDAKEHLSALADKLGSSLPDINVTFCFLKFIVE